MIQISTSVGTLLLCKEAMIALLISGGELVRATTQFHWEPPRLCYCPEERRIQWYKGEQAGEDKVYGTGDDKNAH